VSKELPIVPEPRRQAISRREIAKTLFGGMAAGLLPPGLFSLLSSRQHFRSEAFLRRADEALAARTYQPAFLRTAQFASLIVLSEAIIPGSRRAQSAEFMDLLLSVDNAKAQQQFVSALVAMETTSQAIFRKDIIALSPAELTQLLEAESAKDPGEGPHFGTLKSWTITAYYSSEIGLRELGWTPDRVFPAFPGCTHKESHS
jgi:Gluconate 2-dehydrogenase subunit 3